jgi:hypothetical protein
MIWVIGARRGIRAVTRNILHRETKTYMSLAVYLLAKYKCTDGRLSSSSNWWATRLFSAEFAVRNPKFIFKGFSNFLRDYYNEDPEGLRWTELYEGAKNAVVRW